MSKFHTKSFIGAACLISFMATSNAFALGLRTQNANARAAGQGEAFAAQADDASAVYYNPAGLTQIKGTQFLAGTMLWFPDWHLHGASGVDASMHEFSLLPHGFAASDFGSKDWRFGFGVHNAYGTAVDWGDTGPLRFLATTAKLSVLDFAPSVAYQLTEKLSLGASLNVYYSNVEWNRNVFLGGVLPEAKSTFEGDGWGVGGTVGLLWKLNTQNSIGVVYRSPASIDYKGTSNLESSVLSVGKSPASLEVSYPQMVTVGYAYRPSEKLKLEADVEWVNWDALNTPKFRSPNPAYNNVPVAFNWEDSIGCKFGAEYLLTQHWVLRTGYAYFSNSVPTSTFSPFMPDSDLHTLTAGFGYSTPRWGIDLAYLLNLWQPRHIQNSDNSPSVDGNWKDQGTGVLITATLKF